MMRGLKRSRDSCDAAAEDNGQPSCIQVPQGDIHREETWHPALKGIVTHACTIGTPAPPAHVATGLAFDASSPSSRRLPNNCPLAGSLELCEVSGSHLDYAIELTLGELLENEFVESAPQPHFRRFTTVMDIYETFVPASHRGRGLGDKLVHAAFALAANRGWAVRPSCSFVDRKFKNDNPETPNVAIYEQPSGRRHEVRPRSLFLFSALSDGKDAFKDQRRKLSKKSVGKLVEMARMHCLGPTAAVTSKPVLIERILRSQYGVDAAGFFGYKDDPGYDPSSSRNSVDTQM